MEDAGVKHHSLFPLETCPQVPDEAFKQFHTIDRELYAGLTHLLRRDPAESVQVVAFLMWLEKECGNSTLIKRVTSLPPLLINAVADEATLCVKCVETDSSFPVVDQSDEVKVKLLSELLNFPAGISLRFLHDNRVAVLRGVVKIISTVCWRAFGDLFQRPPPPPPHAMQHVFNPYLDHVPGMIPLPHVPHRPADVVGLPPHVAAAEVLPVENQVDGEREVSPDDRTIFLTFSKGYPITKEEVQDYFNRKFGDFIEALIMQEVEGDEQPLYAKMVARTAAVIDGIVEGNKAKYSINGKHVWARKYVKKPPQQRSPPRGEASTSSPVSKKA